MAISVSDLFKISIDPSSSHTVGPVRAAMLLTAILRQHQALSVVQRLEVHLRGSLSATGVSHSTDHAVIMGPVDEWPDRINPTQIVPRMAVLLGSGPLRLDDRAAVSFDWVCDMRLLDKDLPYHPNTMILAAYGEQGELHQKTYYSVGGGFVVDATQATLRQLDQNHMVLPYDFPSAEELLLLYKRHNLRASELMLANERIWYNEADIREGLQRVWQAMHDYVDSGLRSEGTLPGGLNVQRHATCPHHNLQEANKSNMIGSTLSTIEWVNLFALAVDEENAAGGRVAIAPTSGATRIIPAVLHYYMKLNPGAQDRDIVDYSLATAAVGIPCKKNASIPGAEVGCQDKVGSAYAIATVGLAEVLGATPAQVKNATKIGLECNLGLTCDPIGGLVQVSCIERNAIAAVKTINTAQMALCGNGQHFTSLDKAIRIMRDIGADVHDKYKETSRGGLVVNATEC